MKEKQKATFKLPSIDTISFGKIPPADIKLEEVVLGAIIVESSPTTIKIANLMEEKHFYKNEHVLICKAIKQLVSRGKPVDMITIIHELRSLGVLDVVGGASVVSEMTIPITSSANIDYHFHILLQSWMRREVIRLCAYGSHKAYDESDDIFDTIDELTRLLDQLAPERLKIFNTNASEISENIIKSVSGSSDAKGSIPFYYKTGWKRFDESISIGADRIILISGPAGHGKSKFISSLVFRLLEQYSDSIGVYWVTLEDSSQDVFYGYLSSKVYLKAKTIKQHNFSSELRDEIIHHAEIMQSYDIDFTERSILSRDIVRNFDVFCEDRKDKLNILIVDNILSLADRDIYGKDLNSMYDYVMQKMLECRQRTKGLIFLLHHFKDAQMDKANKITGYRATVVDIKGTESFRRVPNQVLMINKPELYKDLMAEYDGDHKEILKNMFIVDTGKNREDKNNDEQGMIYYFAELDYNDFEEIEILDVPDDKADKNNPDDIIPI